MLRSWLSHNRHMTSEYVGMLELLEGRADYEPQHPQFGSSQAPFISLLTSKKHKKPPTYLKITWV